MKKTFFLVLCAAVIVITAVLFATGILEETPYDDSASYPLVVIYNRDPGLTHSVRIFVSNATEANIFNRTCVLAPNESTESDQRSIEPFQDLTFTLLVDGNESFFVKAHPGPTNIVLFELYAPYGSEVVSHSIIDLTPSGRHPSSSMRGG
jgi:hypothetical protein